MGTLGLVIGVVLLYCLIGAKWAAGAPVYPTSRAARSWVAPVWWLRQAACIHRHEWAYSWHIHRVDYLGRPSPYSGGMQFLDSTWHAAGGKGSAAFWSPREQMYRAYVTWARDGGSWRQWGTASACGLR